MVKMTSQKLIMRTKINSELHLPDIINVQGNSIM